MALPTDACGEGFDACCTALYDIANHLLSEVFDALIVCYPPAPCADPLRAYVTVGAGDDGQVDTVTVAINTVTPTSTSLPGNFGLFQAVFDVRLRESGWPTAYVEGDTIVLPTPEEQVAAARHLYAHGEAIHRRLSKLQTNRRLVPPSVRCTNATIGTMIASSPEGGVVGWSVPVTVDLPWN